MDLFLVLGMLLANIAGWWFAAKAMKTAGRGWFLRHFVGCGAGLFAGFVFIFGAAVAGLLPPPTEEIPALAQGEASPSTVVGQPEPLVGSTSHTENADDLLPLAIADNGPESIKTLGVTPNILVQRINNGFDSADLPFRVDAEGVQKGAVNDVLSAALGAFTALTIVIDNTSGEVKSVVVTGAGDGSYASGLEVLLNAGIVLAAATPRADVEEILTQMPRMGKGEQLVYGDVELSVVHTDNTGTWFAAEPL